MEGTPVLSMVVDDEDRPGLELDLDALVREGARRMLVTALKVEVDAYVAAHAEERDSEGHGNGSRAVQQLDDHLRQFGAEAS